MLKNRNTQFDVDEVVQFQTDFEGRLSSGEREVRQAIEKGNNNVRWMDNNYQTIFDYLSETNKAGRRY